jgi:hypothetical protein
VILLIVPNNFSRPIFTAGSKNVNANIMITNFHCVSIFNGSNPNGKYRANNENRYVTINNGWNTKEITFAVEFTLMKKDLG